MILSVLEKRKWDAQSRLLRRELQDIELLYEQLHSHVAEGKKTHHGGPCIPAVRRLFVDTKGEFFPCERVSEEELFEAGTVNFNYVNPVGLKDETLSRITQKNFRVHRLV